ncbi:porphobilinogen deaminase, putative [Plasmodium gallinaceum]|uniref:hydroxymethylbilane synthase n=1 Tax=Plasmodium gallinaceum TaxID=5849 RepID=A0A1J1GY30_PLAGA|nr:porphobilinogen deaminase, putative [Plasmodium gallinaceum]CRG95912.1 porphobilinogen deaminase, putative [Plasmodium gallinaceum]
MYILVFTILNIYLSIYVWGNVYIKRDNIININYLMHIRNKKLNINNLFRKNNHKKNICYIPHKEIIIGTRDSPLALKQSEKVKKKLLNHFKKINKKVKIILKPIKTTGDKILDKSVSLFGGKGIFTKELDEQLIKNNVDICVHSLKDVPMILPEDIYLPCFLKRDTINDVFLSIKYKNLNQMNKCKFNNLEKVESNIKNNFYLKKDEDKDSLCTVATSSLRRRSQIKYMYKNIELKSIRGNINTRLVKLFNGYCDSIIIALCGLERLIKRKVIVDIVKNKKRNIHKPYIIRYNNTSIDLSFLNIQKINRKFIYPALCQGIIAITSNKNNSEINDILKDINDEKSEIMGKTERAFLSQIEGNCMMPIGGYTKIVNNKIFFNAIINDIHGYEKFQIREKGEINNYLDIATNAATNIKKIIGVEKFHKIKEEAALYYK